MCGIAGFIDPGLGSLPEASRVLKAMTDTMVRRGPDDEGLWHDEGLGVHLGFRRLAIQDLSQAGHQPMASPSGRYVVVFNGEIYNFEKLRSELGTSAPPFRGHSDTEVLLAAIESWGLDRVLPRLRGMFAFALIDREEGTLVLCRDRMGIKPLYLMAIGPALVFSSELRGLLAHPLVPRRGNPDAAWHFLRNLYVPAPLSMVAGAEKILPGRAVRFRIREGRVVQREDRRFWHLGEVSARAPDAALGPQDTLERLHGLVSDAIRLRLIADVPVGALLSGGIDSSLVVAMMQAQADRPVRTFTVRFDDPRFDEGEIAAEVGRRLGTAHTEVELPTSRVQDLIPSLPEFSDEPMANPSLLPTLLVSEVARREVVVALSGDGGDEVFGGYNRYVQASGLMTAASRLPPFLRRPAGAALRVLAEQPWIEHLGKWAQPRSLGDQHPFGARLDRAAGIVGADSLLDAYREMMAVGGRCPPIPTPVTSRSLDSDKAFTSHSGSVLGRMMLHDQLQYLPDDLLAKVDRASMWVSLEARVPLLDHHVVEFAWGIPESLKVRNGVTKWVLRELLARYLPRELFDRPKMGFTVPVERWLRGGLSEWVGDLLAEDRLVRRGLYDVPSASRLLRSFRTGQSGLAVPVWALAVLEAWCGHWGVSFD